VVTLLLLLMLLLHVFHTWKRQSDVVGMQLDAYGAWQYGSQPVVGRVGFNVPPNTL